MNKKYLIAIVIFLVGGGIYFFLNANTGKTFNIERAPIDSEISAVNLVQAFEKNEARANSTYANKVLKVKGMLIDVKTLSELELQVTLEADSDMGTVVCNIQTQNQESLDELKIGEIINVKGLCTGYLFDVVLDHSIIVN